MIFISVLTFEAITLKNRDKMMDVLSRGHRASTEYSFASNFIWREVYDLSASVCQDMLIIRSNEQAPTYIFPSGGGQIKPVMDALLAHERQSGRKLSVNTIVPEDAEKLMALYPDAFVFENNRDGHDYLYETESLISLSGKKLSSKRNHINRFEEMQQDWQLEPITADNVDEVREMNRQWCTEMNCKESKSLSMEHMAVEQALIHMQPLQLDGALIRSRGQILAFALGEPLNDDTYIVHAEKAKADVQGAYQIINREFAAMYAKDYLFINREDDAGDEGLRKAKLSYRPVRMVEKLTAIQVRDITP